MNAVFTKWSQPSVSAGDSLIRVFHVFHRPVDNHLTLMRRFESELSIEGVPYYLFFALRAELFSDH